MDFFGMVTSSRYQQQFARYKTRQHKAFIPFILLGWPSFEASYRQAQALIAAGAFALEIGLPFSDPVADGVVIQQAVFEAITTGFTLEQAWPWLAKIRQLQADIPLGLLVYNNMIQAVGTEAFAHAAFTAGVDSVLVADLPPEMADPWVTAAKEKGLDTVFIVSSLTTPERLARVMTMASGFLYGVSRLGITGVENRYDAALPALINTVHQHTSLPVCVGFGISHPDDARQMIALGADGVITGSKIIQLLQQKHANQTEQDVLSPFVASMQAVCQVPLLTS
jgi:tryptophan synthase alpha chain